MRISLVLGVIGQLLRYFCLAFLAPLGLALFDGEYDVAGHFAVASVVSLIAGIVLAKSFRRGMNFGRAEALGVVAGSWMVLGHISAIPYVFAGLSPVDALFESISGFTTTGATILQDFSLYGRAFYLWRSMTQWFGGLGVIALFVVILPQLGIAGRQLFFAEASGAPGEAASPQVRQGASRLWMLYIGLTLTQTALLMGLAKWPFYDSICHAFTTMAAGGFSPNPESIQGYHNPTAEWIFIVFMILGGTSFPLLWTSLTRKPKELIRDGEFQFYFGCTLVVGVLIGGVLVNGIPDLEAVRTGLFQSASMISSTGYASADFAATGPDQPWNDAARGLLIFVMLVGGCAGSAAGGAKAVRILLMLKFLWREITRVLHPRAVLPLRHKGRPIPDPILRAVFNLVSLYLVGYFVLAMALIFMGIDLVTGFTASLACLGNIGPAFGAAGPMGNFADFPVAAKLLLTFAMWIGRLEVVTVLALLHPHVWRNMRWKADRPPGPWANTS
ncbi:MAG: TrkH family potassium uptake protein [Planctomycetota bacterium]|nr:MAG: TrkH family potassium uptake protein [Planctomycetota bacterium]